MMAEDHPEWFNTPVLTFLSMRKEILGKFLDESSWGEFGTEKQVIAISSLLGYFKKTRNLADQFPQLSADVTVENKNLAIQRTLHLPEKLYEQLLLALVEGVEEKYQSIWEQPSCVTLQKIEQFLERRRISCLAAYQSRVWSDVQSSQKYPCDTSKEVSEENNFTEKEMKVMLQARADLRKLRNKISARIQCRQNVRGFISKYNSLTQAFIARFESELTVDETETLRKRVRIAKNAALGSSSKVRVRKHTSETQRPKHEDCKIAREVLHSGHKSSIVQDQAVQNLPDEIELILPDIPDDSDNSPADFAHKLGEDIDEQLRERLTRLQFFSQTWSQRSGHSSSPFFTEVETGDLNDADTVAKVTQSLTAVDDSAPVVASAQERLDFNNWYYAKVDRIHTQQSQPVPATSTVPTISPMNLPSQSNMTLIPTSEQQSFDMVITSQPSDPIMTNSTSTIANLKGSQEQQLLEVVTNLCHMQANVVAMCMMAAFTLDKLSRMFNCATNIPKAAPLVTKSSSEDPLLSPWQAELGQVSDQVVELTSVATPKCSWNVTPWKRRGIVFTKLF